MHLVIKLTKGIHDILFKGLGTTLQALNKHFQPVNFSMRKYLDLPLPNSKKVYKKEISGQKCVLEALREKRMCRH